MHVERAERLPALHDEVADLFQVVSRFRWRLALERLLVFALHGLIGSAIAAIVLSLAVWLLDGAQVPVVNQVRWLLALPLVAALGLAVARWPTHRQAALAADRRLVLDERLGTAIELAQRIRGSQPSGRFDRLQLRDAVQQATTAPNVWLVLDRRARREAQLTMLLVVVGVASLVVLPGLPRPSLPSADQSGPQSTGVSAHDALESTVVAGAVSPPAPVQAQPAPQSLSSVDSNLAAKVEHEQGEQAALDSLSRALGRVSAAQPAADAMQQRDFSSAKQELSTLGDEADQLSDAAKQQLARALQDAASASGTDRQLADRERQAAQALNRGTYADQRQAVHNLADQVERSGQSSVSSDQLALDQGRLQQQQQAGGQASAPAANGDQAAADTASAGSTDGQQASSGGQGDGSQGQQGGPGVGTGSDPQPVGDQPSRLDSSGQTVTVPTKLGAGPGVRPPNGSEDQAGRNPTAGDQTVSELVQSQQTGQVAAEQNLVPGEQRPVVRGYFR